MGMGRHILRRETLGAIFFSFSLTSGWAEIPPQTPGVGRQVAAQESFSQALPVRQGHLGAEVYTMEIPGDPSVSRQLELLLDFGRERVEAALKRGASYRRFIASQLDSLGLPRELRFLPVLESEYRMWAASRSGALGIWQFMRNTAIPFRLRMDEWVDERKDFQKSTAAALAKLQENYRYFGDWPLALAAYNCGLGKLARIVRASGVRDFWALRKKGLLPRETAEYVPKFYALAELCSYPGRYGLELGWEEAVVWERLELHRSIDLELLARESEIPVEVLKTGNQELKLPVTPAYEEGYWLKVPAQHAERAATVLADPGVELLKFQYHTVRSGDTLYGLAKRFGIGVELIKKSNSGLNPSRLALGSLIKIPLAGGRKPVPEPAATAKAAPGFTSAYTVRKGDTLWQISKSLGLNPEELAAANGKGLLDILKEGEVLKVPPRE